MCARRCSSPPHFEAGGGSEDTDSDGRGSETSTVGVAGLVWDAAEGIGIAARVITDDPAYDPHGEYGPTLR